MDATSFLDLIQHCFDHVPKSDRRAKIGPKNLLTALIFCLTADSKRRSIDGLRREITAMVGIRINRSSFWERLATDRLRRLLVEVLSMLMNALGRQAGLNLDIADVLKVSRVYLLDSCSTSLPDDADETYPGPRNNTIKSSIKWHFCMDLLSGVMRWYSLTPAIEHDRRHFPSFALLKGALTIFDLGYWDYKLIADLIAKNCFFLCRVKTNAIINVVGVSKGAQYKLLGRDLMDFNWRRKRDEIIEMLGSFCQEGEELFAARVIGFWNPVSGYYHWYTTNLSVVAELIYPAYRLRWQVELAFKSAKGSLRLEDIPSANNNIIFSLVVASLIRGLLIHPLTRVIGEEETVKSRKASISFQRAASLLTHIGSEFRRFIISPTKTVLTAFLKKLQLLSADLYDPNYKSRCTSIGRILGMANRL